MKFEDFNEIIDLLIGQEKIFNVYEKSLCTSLLEVYENQNKAIEKFWSTLLTEEGYEHLTFFLYEKGFVYDGVGPFREMLDEKENPIKTTKDLYDYLNRVKGFKTKELVFRFNSMS